MRMYKVTMREENLGEEWQTHIWAESERAALRTFVRRAVVVDRLLESGYWRFLVDKIHTH